MFKPSFCANTDCIRHTEHRGGKFRFINGKEYCMDCSENQAVMNPGKELWSFTTTHFDGHPVKVKSLSHLRQLEKQYGCSNHAANYDQRNW